MAGDGKPEASLNSDTPGSEAAEVGHGDDSSVVSPIDDYGICVGCGYSDGDCQCFDFEDAEEDFDCGQDRHGNCGKAGSEECDFECPYRGRL